MADTTGIRMESIRELVTRLVPDVDSIAISRFGTDDATGEGEGTEKRFGYGAPVHIKARRRSGQLQQFVLHTAKPDIFGHDRRADRAQAMILCADTFGSIPRHVAAVDVGAVSADGHLHSMQDSSEFYLLTRFAPGALYADDLRRIAHTHTLTDRDRRRCVALAEYLAALHRQRLDGPALYRRAIRDLVGHGEGIFGIIDGYPAEADGATDKTIAGRLRAIEAECCEWRWRLRERTSRLSRTHGDFHPFNILFDEDDEIALLDASRGCCGDPADDVCCLAINYIFFALGDRDAWRRGMRELWDSFWDKYLTASNDGEVLEVAAPFLAWRGLVLANPTWYPAMSAASRDTLLTLIEDTLRAERFDPARAEALFR